MKSLSHRQKKILDRVGVVLLTAICVIAAVWFIYTVQETYNEGSFRPLDHQKVAIPIYSWMTFDYLNVIFKLPSTYLQQQLSITNRHYPDIRIDTYAKENHLDAQALLYLIQQDISRYSPSVH